LSDEEILLLGPKTAIKTSKVVCKYLAKQSLKLLKHQPDSIDLAPAVFFLVPRLKNMLAGLTLFKEPFKKELGGGHEK